MEDETLVPSRTGIAETSDGCRIHYKIYQSPPSNNSANGHGTTEQCIVMIPGIATDYEGWKFQIKDLLFSEERHLPLFCCVMDNRGIGDSSAPSSWNAYSTERMADDIIETADSIGWKVFHCMGFSMGGMIACKVASIVPERLQSLTILGTTGGGWQMIPRNCFGIWNAILSGLACTPRLRSYCDLHFHFMPKTLYQTVDENGTTRFDLLMREYMTNSMKKSQSASGLAGQLRACWYHGLSPTEFSIIRNSDFPVTVIHGRYDRLAHPRFGRKLAKHMGGEYTEVMGAHMIKRECRHEVSRHLLHILNNQRN